MLCLSFKKVFHLDEAFVFLTSADTYFLLFNFLFFIFYSSSVNHLDK